MAGLIQPFRMPLVQVGGFRKPVLPVLDETHPISRGHIGFWPLGDNAVSLQRDISQFGQDGSITSGPLSLGSSHHGGQSLVLNGTGYLTLPAGMPASSSISVGLWINPSSLANAYSSLALRFTSSTNEWQLLLKSSGKLAFYLSNGQANPISIDPGSISIPTNAWSHVAFTFDGLSQRLYVNGVLDTAVNAFAAGGLLGITASILIGQDSQTGGRLFPGSVEGLRISSQVWTPSQILQLVAEPYVGVLDAALPIDIAAVLASTTTALLMRSTAVSIARDGISAAAGLAAKSSGASANRSGAVYLATPKVRSMASASSRGGAGFSTGLSLRSAAQQKSSGGISARAALAVLSKAMASVFAAISAAAPGGLSMRSASAGQVRANMGAVAGVVLKSTAQAKATFSAAAPITQLVMRSAAVARAAFGSAARATMAFRSAAASWGIFGKRSQNNLGFDPALISFVEPGKTTTIVRPGKTTTTAIPGKTTTIVR